MENLENLGVVEMKQGELQETEGGVLFFWIGVAIGVVTGLIVFD